MEVHDPKVIVAAENIKVDLALHVFELGVEGIVPDYIAVLNCIAIIGVPVKVFSDQFCISDVHLDDRYVFVQCLIGWLRR